MKSGKVDLGYRSTLKDLRKTKAKLIIVSNNCPALRRSEIEYYALLSGAGVHHYNGNNIDLGTACGKYFRVSVLAITDAGDSDRAAAGPFSDANRLGAARNFPVNSKDVAAVLIGRSGTEYSGRRVTGTR